MLTVEDKACNEKQREMCLFNHGEFFDWACENCPKNSRQREMSNAG